MSVEPVATAALAPVREGLFSTDPPALTGGRCERCGSLGFPRREVCPRCQHAVLVPVALSTTGVVHTFTIVRIAPPGYRGEVPYAYGIVELPEALRITATLTADDLEAIAIGDTCDFELIELGSGEDRVLSYAYNVRRVQP